MSNRKYESGYEKLLIQSQHKALDKFFIEIELFEYLKYKNIINDFLTKNVRIMK